MIAKVTRGRSFKGLQSYLEAGKDGRQGDRVDWISTRNLPGDDPELAAQAMRATAARSSLVEKPVYHLTLSLSPGEELDREAMIGVVDRTLTDLGLQEHQALLVAHDDTRHQHVHVMVNRVHPETERAWRPSHDYARIERSLREQEREMGLREVPGRHYALSGQERHLGVELSSADRRVLGRTGDRPFAEHVREVIRADLSAAGSWGDLHRRLGDYGLQLEKRGRGLVITDGERRVKASFVDRGSSLQQLEKRLGLYRDPERGPGPGREGPAAGGPTVRWRDLEQLRRATERLVRYRDLDSHQERYLGARNEARLSVELDRRLRRRLESASKELDRRLGLAYRNPQSAREAFDQLAEKRGLGTAARELAARPERFGALRGRGGPLPSRERREALAAVARVPATVGELAGAKQAVERQRGSRSDLARSIRLARRTWRAARRIPLGPSERDLAAAAASLVKQVGWELAARALPAPRYQLLRITLSLAPRAMHRAMDLGRDMPL